MTNNFKLTFIIFSSSFFFFLGCRNENKKTFKSNFWIDEQKVYWEELLNKNKKWYSSNHAISIADNILIYQHPSGGWPKNIDYKTPIAFINKIKLIISKKFNNSKYSYHPTIDNRSTYSQIRFLGKVFISAGNQRFKDGFLSGFDYLISAQNQAGGWPQYYPLRGGYKNHITFNDNAMIGVMKLLKDVSDKKYNYIDDLRLKQSENAIKNGLELILNTQIISNDRLSGWCSQYDEIGLDPINARSFEPISISARESVNIVKYLMALNDPDKRIIGAIESAIEWYKEVGIKGLKIVEIEDADAPKDFDIKISIDSKNKLRPLHWARFYELNTNSPIFSDRDGIIRYAMSELSYERRINYEWYGTWANNLIFKHYPIWTKRYKKNNLEIF